MIQVIDLKREGFVAEIKVKVANCSIILKVEIIGVSRDSCLPFLELCEALFQCSNFLCLLRVEILQTRPCPVGLRKALEDSRATTVHLAVKEVKEKPAQRCTFLDTSRWSTPLPLCGCFPPEVERFPFSTLKRRS